MIEKRSLEIRNVTGRTLEGVALTYNDEAIIAPGMRETFQPSAFTPIEDVILNSHHDRSTPLARTGGGGLVIEDSPTELRIRAELPKTTMADDTLALVRSKVLRGLSIEFVATEERLEGDLRIVERAHLSAISVVDSPAYAGSTVEARAKKRVPKTWVKNDILYGVQCFCECLTGECNRVIFAPKSLGPAPGVDALATVGRFSEALGSTSGATLRLKNTPKALEIELSPDARNTAAGETLTDLRQAKVPVYSRPLVDDAVSAFTETNGVRTYTKAGLNAVLFKPIAGAAEKRLGWTPIVFVDNDDDDQPKPPRRRSVLAWL